MWKVGDAEGCLPVEVLRKLSDELALALDGEKEVVFSGGEPLLYEGILDIVRIYTQKGLKVGIASNGVLINKKMAGDLVDAGVKNIQLSLDSSHSETHDFLRGVKRVHEKVLKAAEYLSAYKDRINVCAQMVISGKNIHEVEDTVRFVKDSGVFSVISFMAVTTPFFTHAGENWRQEGDFSFLWPRGKEASSVLEKIIGMKRDRFPIANPVEQLKMFQSYFEDPASRKTGIVCRLGDYVVSIDPHADVRLCCFMEPIGNIKKQSLMNILDSEMADRYRKTMHDCNKVCNTIVNCFFQGPILKAIN